PRLARFRERFPRIDLVLKTSRYLADFRREDIDLAIRFGPAEQRELRAVRLMGELVYPVASPSLVSAARVPLPVEALADWPLLHDVDAPGQRWMNWRAWLERAGVDPSRATRGLQFTDSVVIIAAATAGLGIALGRSPHVDDLLARGQLVRLTREEWQADWAYHLVAPAPHFSRPNVRAFVDWASAEGAAGSG
ncbi:MAG TPA: LysR substrate-binding domain-containing protein, partial [Steroidobacteraceae bacterium]|nr:LysR substrate-binding domain-containing protein [Steroidobacteraceae bacterium]